MRMSRTLGLAFLLIAAATPSAAAQAANGLPRTTRDGVYTEPQARRGAVIMTEVCAECHLGEVEFTGAFLRSWSGATVGALFEVISTQMPEDRPGSLEPQEYAEVVAYILSLNGVPAGTRELPSQIDSLLDIRIEGNP